jgi:hypothetical protein
MTSRSNPRYSAAIVTLVLALSSSLARAHSGHPITDAEVSHLLTSPYHLATLALGGAALWGVARFVERQLPRRSLQGLGALAILASVALWGWCA